jgi:hypothetical protein
VLDGGRISGVDVELLSLDGNQVLARTMTDGAGQVTFPDVPPGRYILKATARASCRRFGAVRRARRAVTQVLLDIQLTFVAPSVSRCPASPTQSIQPVSASDMLADRCSRLRRSKAIFQSLLRCFQSSAVLTGGCARRRPADDGALQVAAPASSTVIRRRLQLPGRVRSVEIFPLAEYGRFSSSVFDWAARHRLGNQAPAT